MIKKTYIKPSFFAKRLELESPICGGSATIISGDIERTQAGIQDQEFNSDFGTVESGKEWQE